MTYSEFTTLVATHLDVDARRRGSEVLIEAATQAAIKDLKFYIPRFKDGITRYQAGDLTMMTDEAAEVVAEYVKSRIARNVRNDIPLSREHKADYMKLRQRLFLASSTVERPSYTIGQGEPLTITVPLLVNGVAAPIEGWKVWFTVKANAGKSDEHAVAQLDLTNGITPAGLTGWLVRMPKEATKYTQQGKYTYEIEAENPLGEPYVIEVGDIILEAEINRVA